MRSLFIALAICITSLSYAVSAPFPKLSLYSLQGEVRLLPSGKKELVFVGCRGDASHALTRWYQLFSEHREAVSLLSVMVVPVFPSFMSNRLFRHPLMALIRQRIPEHLSQHVGVLFSNAEEAASLFHISRGDLDQLQVFLIDEKGDILWKASGEPTPQTLSQLKQLLSNTSRK